MTAGTISRSPSGLFENSSLTAAIAGLASLLVMAGFLSGIGDFGITSCHDRFWLSEILRNLQHATPQPR